MNKPMFHHEFCGDCRDAEIEKHRGAGPIHAADSGAGVGYSTVHDEFHRGGHHGTRYRRHGHTPGTNKN